MSEAQDSSSLLRRPLYIFDLPRELLFSLALRDAAENHQDQHEDAEQHQGIQTPAGQDASTFQYTSCNLCRVTFKSVDEQRSHVKSDFHRYNLKLSLKELPAIDEATFIRMIGDLDESISGSDTSDSDEEDSSKDDTLSALLKKQAKLHQPDDKAQNDRHQKRVAGNAPIVWMSSPKVDKESLLGIYRAVFSVDELQAMSQSPVETLHRKQLKAAHAKQSGKASTTGIQQNKISDPHYFLCMIGGGHFAAMIVSLVPEIRRGPGGVEERHPIVLAHKTFHRYTTRRKQGGSQSANDNAKGTAHSVGSSIRRANEAVLEVEVRGVLSDWRSMIASAEMLFIRATGSANRRTLLGPYDGQVLNSKDERLRSFPFSTKRATQSEVLRAFHELTRLKVTRVIEMPQEASKPELSASQPSRPKVEAPRPTPEEAALQLHTAQLLTLIRRSKAPALLLYLAKNNLSANFSFHPAAEHHHAPTPLHLSASTNSPALVSALLLKAQPPADPTLANTAGKTPYDLAGDSRTRDAFRVARHTLGEDANDWTAAHVPSALSTAEADARARQEKSAQEAAEAERRKNDLSRMAAEEEAGKVGRLERKAGTGKSLSAAAEKSGAEKREEEARGLTPEMRTRLERERRARAAEERMRRLQGS